MYKIIIFGTGSGAEKVINSLNEDTKIIAFSDNDEKKQGMKLRGIAIINPNYLKNFSYDYIVIASQCNLQIKKQLINMNIDKNKIFDFYFYLSNKNFIKDNIKYFIESKLIFEVIVTGISYVQSGFKSSICNIQPIKFCFASQDLFYDYHIVKYLIENYKEKMLKVNYAVIGISYYSFEYDMSLSAMKSRVKLYYDSINLKHNLKDESILRNDDSIDIAIADKILKKDKNNLVSIDWIKKDNVSNLKNKYEVG